ncbi:MAG: transcriptional regulator [Candidatus Methanoperedens sp.]|nr:transcriptional regulator [Candidatus Methanoperedens sp.]
MASKGLYLAVITMLFLSTAGAALENEYKITYTIDVKDDGTAVWNVEYRTALVSDQDFSSFDNYTKQLQSVYLNDFTGLMQNSVSEASVATLRGMAAKDFSGTAIMQSTPTGKYGVVHYSFTWTNFAKADSSNLNIGDVFVGGLYLSRDNTLIIKYPEDYTVEAATPAPDHVRDGMIWYGLRSFGAGEPRIVLLKTQFPWIPLVIVIFIIGAGAFIYIRWIRKVNSNEAVPDITETEMMNLEDRIVKLLKEKGGSVYQSEIGKILGLPKSTVSTALNELYNKNIIQKIKKGRENLIRLVSEQIKDGL